MTNPMTWTDATTQAAISGGCPDAWTVVIDGTRRYLLHILLSQGATFHEAEDLTQLTWARAWERRHQFQHGNQFAPNAFRGWLTTIAINAWRDQCRQRHRAVQVISHCDLSAELAYDYGNAPTPERTAEQAIIREEEVAEAHATVARLAGRISPQHRRRVPLLLEAERDGPWWGGAARVSIPRAMAATGLGRSAAKSAICRTRIALRHAALGSDV